MEDHSNDNLKTLQVSSLILREILPIQTYYILVKWVVTYLWCYNIIYYLCMCFYTCEITLLYNIIEFM